LTENYDVAVIGAGVIGTLIARSLSRYNLRVALLEKLHDVAQGTTKANSAIVHAGFDAKPGTFKAKYNVRGAAMMPELCQTLHVPYANNGALVLGFDDDDVPVLESLLERGRRNKVPGLRLIGKEELLAMEPNVNPCAVGALYAPSGGIVSPFDLAIAAAECAVANGVDFYRDFDVARINQHDTHFSIYSAAGKKRTAKLVVNAAGVHADDVAHLVGDDSFHISPRRGEYLLLDNTQAGVVNATIFQCPSDMGKGVLITPTVHHNILIGPSADDIDVKDDLSTTDPGLKGIQTTMRLSVPGYQIKDVITSFSGLRAHSNTGDFVLRPSLIDPRFIHAAGIESPGLSASPAIAAYVVKLFADVWEEELSEKTNWNPGRPKPLRIKELSREERREAIKKRPEYGRIVCRCETVSEGEIIDAIRAPAGARDMDGVKRRTRAGMGRCQAGFCGTKVLEILSRELQLPPQEITKFGAGSQILLGKTK
jgi:glycerol-3-phosphate dehydrogenase